VGRLKTRIEELTSDNQSLKEELLTQKTNFQNSLESLNKGSSPLPTCSHQALDPESFLLLENRVADLLESFKSSTSDQLLNDKLELQDRILKLEDDLNFLMNENLILKLKFSHLKTSSNCSQSTLSAHQHEPLSSNSILKPNPLTNPL